jgi:hypothetical protein
VPYQGHHTGNGSGLTSLDAKNISTGTLSAARIDASLTRDSEVMPIVLASDGAGSSLDADLLDGLDSSSFVRTTQMAAFVEGLSLRLKEKDAEIQQLKRSFAELKVSLDNIAERQSNSAAVAPRGSNQAAIKTSPVPDTSGYVESAARRSAIRLR